ncbi:MAG: efflux RND transporter periplasmic adaptor subunit [Pseudomonas sp.]
MLRKLVLMLLIFILAVAALGAWKFWSIKQQIAIFTAPKPPIQISASVAETHEWQSRLPAIGSLTARQGVELTAEIAGTVDKVLFESGQHVEAGQQLLVMNDQVERASLATAEAQVELARLDFTRQQNLLQRQSISQAQFDQASSTLRQAQARASESRAILQKKTITAPFAGRLGIIQVDPGDYLSPGSLIATLQDLSSLYVDFSLAEQHYPQLSTGQQVELTVAAFPDQHFTGEITAINPRVEASTRTLLVRARVSNPEEQLLPGMFAELDVLMPDVQQRVIVPETAITFSLYGHSVYVVEPVENQQPAEGEQALQVKRRFVTTGERRAGQVVVLQGLEEGEQVVSAGQLKLNDGATVVINNSNPL